MSKTQSMRNVCFGSTRTYENELGQPAANVLDVQAFATCP